MNNEKLPKWMNVFLGIIVIAFVAFIIFAFVDIQKQYADATEPKLEVKVEKPEYDSSISVFVFRNIVMEDTPIKEVDLWALFSLVEFSQKGEVVGTIRFTERMDSLVFEGDVKKTRDVILEYMKHDKFYDGLFKFSFNSKKIGGDSK